jgi:hypothetical protein
VPEVLAFLVHDEVNRKVNLIGWGQAIALKQLVDAKLSQVVIVGDNIVKLDFLIAYLVKTFEGCAIVLAHVLADVAVFVENFGGDVIFTRCGVGHLSKMVERRAAITAPIPKRSRRTAPIAREIHRGESTQSQLQEMTPPSFKPMKRIARAPVKPMPPDEEEEELDIV